MPYTPTALAAHNHGPRDADKGSPPPGASDLRELKSPRTSADEDGSAPAAVLAAGVAHEINNPLATIMTSLGFVFDQLRLIAADLPEASETVSQRIRQSLDALEDTRASGLRIQTIIRDLRAFVPDTEARSSVDVNETMRAVLRGLEQDMEISVPIVTDFGDPPHIDANPARIAQIFSSLIANAIEAVPGKEARHNEVRISTRSSDGAAVVSVSDTGVGIPANVRPRIFDAFFTTKSPGEGVGLGLFVVHAVVTSMKGHIEVDTVVADPESGPDAETASRGTKFTLYLPGNGEPPRSRKSLK